MKTETERVSHTAGPWKAIEPTHANEMTSIFAKPPRGSGDQPWLIGYALREANPGQRPIDDANARLMAASPDFLWLVERMLDIMNAETEKKWKKDELARSLGDWKGRAVELLARTAVKQP